MNETLRQTDCSDVFMKVAGLLAMPSGQLEDKLKSIIILDRLAPFVDAEKMMVTQTLASMINSRGDEHRPDGPNALRLLARIGDEHSPVNVLTNNIKAVMSGQSPRFVAAASMAALSFAAIKPDLAPSYQKFAENALRDTKKSGASHHLLLSLLYALREGDINEMLHFMTRTYRPNTTNELGCESFVRICESLAKKIIATQHNAVEPVRALLSAVRSTMTASSSLMVSFEGVRVILTMPRQYVDEQTRTFAFTQISILLEPRHGAIRLLGAVRLVSTIAPLHPDMISVQAFTDRLRALTTNPNHMIACYALIALLNSSVVSQAGVADVVQSIVTIMHTIPEHLKAFVLQSVMKFATKFKETHGPVLTMLAASLREEGSLDLKASIFHVIREIVTVNPAQREAGLLHLCEFLEDCEYATIATAILHLLAEHVPRLPYPERFIRVICNRLLLENVIQRTVAIDALLRIAAADDVQPTLKASITHILSTFRDEPEDDVRDRVAMALYILQGDGRPEARDVIFPVEKDVDAVLKALEDVDPTTIDPAAALCVGVTLEQPLIPEEPELTVTLPTETDEAVTGKALVAHQAETELTDPHSQAYVRYKKVIFERCILIEFTVRNTYGSDLALSRPRMVLTPVDGLQADIEPLPSATSIAPDEEGAIFVKVSPKSGDLPIGAFTCRLEFIATEEGDDDGFEEAIDIHHPVELLTADYVVPVAIPTIERFRLITEGFAAKENQVTTKFVLPPTTQPSSLEKSLAQMLNMHSMPIPADDALLAGLAPLRTKCFSYGLSGRFVFAPGDAGLMIAVVCAYKGTDGDVTLAMRVRAATHDMCNIVVQSVA